MAWELLPGKRLLWRGQPQRTLWVGKADLPIIAAGVACAIGAFFFLPLVARPAMVLRNISRAAEVYELFETTRIAAGAR